MPTNQFFDYILSFIIWLFILIFAILCKQPDSELNMVVKLILLNNIDDPITDSINSSEALPESVWWSLSRTFAASVVRLLWVVYIHAAYTNCQHMKLVINMRLFLFFVGLLLLSSQFLHLHASRHYSSPLPSNPGTVDMHVFAYFFCF